MGIFKAAKPTSTVTTSSPPRIFLVTTLALRFLQFVFALAVIGVYGQNVNAARKSHTSSDSKEVYALVVGSLSAVTCVVYAIVDVLMNGMAYWGVAWDWCLFILWTAVFGVFGKIYIHSDTHGNSDLKQMKNAVWIDLINMLLWLITGILSVVLFFTMRRRRSLHTGRAAV